jgi:hypothetical protein
MNFFGFVKGFGSNYYYLKVEYYFHFFPKEFKIFHFGFNYENLHF